MLLVVHVIERISDRRQETERQRDANLLLYGEERFADFRRCTQQSFVSQPALLLATQQSNSVSLHKTYHFIVYVRVYK